ncbi:MAG: c-type cytochrome [Hyphomicrobiales bacterium]|nr:c-type cytochrome [Hyphomicrobiales bacterium]
MFASLRLRTRIVALALAAVLSPPALAVDPNELPTPGSPARGAELILSHGCGACHQIPGIEGASGLVGPPLTLMGRRVFIAGLLQNTPQNLAAWVHDPQRFVLGNAMPATGLSEADALDVAAYLESIQ